MEQLHTRCVNAASEVVVGVGGVEVGGGGWGWRSVMSQKKGSNMMTFRKKTAIFFSLVPQAAPGGGHARLRRDNPG